MAPARHRSTLLASILVLTNACSGASEPGEAPADGSSTEPPGETSDPADDSSSSEPDDASSSSSTGADADVAMCDPWDVEACDEGFKCMPYDAPPIELAWDANGCFPIAADPAQPGDTCEVSDSAVDGTDSCAIGAMCMPDDFEDLGKGGVCIAFCEGTADAPGCSEPSETCIIANDGVLNLCLTMCDPTLQDCATGEGCYLNPTDSKFICFQQDEAAQDSASDYGVECGSINFCDPGLQCVEGVGVPSCSAEYCCTAFCDLDDPAGDEQCPDHTAGQRCLPHFPTGAEPPGYAHIGLCGIPQ